jgi:hypothetical protein
VTCCPYSFANAVQYSSVRRGSVGSISKPSVDEFSSLAIWGSGQAQLLTWLLSSYVQASSAQVMVPPHDALRVRKKIRATHYMRVPILLSIPLLCFYHTQG